MSLQYSVVVCMLTVSSSTALGPESSCCLSDLSTALLLALDSFVSVSSNLVSYSVQLVWW